MAFEKFGCLNIHGVNHTMTHGFYPPVMRFRSPGKDEVKVCVMNITDYLIMRIPCVIPTQAGFVKVTEIYIYFWGEIKNNNNNKILP